MASLRNMATAVFVAAASATLAACGGDTSPPPERAAGAPATAAADAPEPAAADAPETAAADGPANPTGRVEARKRPRGVVEDCASRSEADFPGAYADPDNIVVGPLALVGAAHTPRSTLREVGGDKIMALVEAGHRVTVALPGSARPVAGLAYGPPTEAVVELKPRDGHQAVTFIACGPGEPSGSTVDGKPVTFWSGAILASSPRCLPLLVWVDDERRARQAMVRMGVRRCA
jgi:hypothetical protein